jgi:hypothetical protein
MTIEPQMLSVLVQGYRQHGTTFALDDYTLRKLAWRLDHLLVSAEHLEDYLEKLCEELGPIDRKRRSAGDQTSALRHHLGAHGGEHSLWISRFGSNVTRRLEQAVCLFQHQQML